MNTLDLLLHRRSTKKFGDLAPNKAQLDNILKAGLRAPDHGKLKPYHFVVVEQEKMPQLRQYLEDAAQEFNMPEEKRAKAKGISERAPLIIGVVAKLEHDIAKVPAWEQMLTAGSATYAMQLAANAQGFETVWITGKWVEGTALRQAFGCREGDKVVALIMIGSPQEGDQITLASQTENLDGFVSYL